MLRVRPSKDMFAPSQPGALRLLTIKYPEVKTAGVCVMGSNLASLTPVGLRTKEYLQKLNIKHPDLMKIPDCERIAFTYEKIEWSWKNGASASEQWQS